ncbi:amidohydrolase [Caballeronia novacaledonica]|uniref:Amidohydrolase n=1 Tax=Caballeronia novacaledonica TaxID=1544861 RepID=A0A2U3IAE7_9BURK|nr:amidohydrolase family protein [Caballeronia novacaledonica]SPB17176.1 amidohydrolase [Caballeronia novacaledonica]
MARWRRALSLDRQLGSLEAGKQADIILVDLFKPHLMPMNIAVYRVTCFANAGDVCMTMVAGKILMEDYRVLSVDEGEILERVTQVADRTAGCAGDAVGAQPLLKLRPVSRTFNAAR